MARSPEQEFEALDQELERLPCQVQRRVLSLLGVAVGDSVGLPFELHAHRDNRQQADVVAERGDSDFQLFVLERIVSRLGRRGASSAYARTFSDDTVVTDLKMAAVAQCSALLQRPAYGKSDANEILFRCFLSQLLAWEGGPAAGQLFQGFGGFTKQLLRPDSKIKQSIDIGEGIQGCDTWPEEWFARHAEEHMSGRGQYDASYGNGAVMSFVPQVIAADVFQEAVDSPGASAAKVAQAVQLGSALNTLAGTHRHEHAKQGAQLLEELMREILSGAITRCDQLREAVRRCPSWTALQKSAVADSPAYALREFDTYLTEGDCTEEEVQTFLLRFSREEAPLLAPEMKGAYLRRGPHSDGEVPESEGRRMGQLLRTASNWDDDRPRQKQPRHLTLENGEPVRFSQRGLNSVVIAIWCVCGARSCWDWITRMLYVGGDTDTVGAVCGQIAGPLLPRLDVCKSFQRFVGVLECPARKPCARVVTAASARYYRRAVLFSTGQWRDLIAHPRLVDPAYEPLTDAAGTRALGAPPVRVIWLDNAFTQHPQAGRTAHQRRVAAADASARGLIDLKTATTMDQARSLLQRARGDRNVDVVVTELHLRHERQIGLEILQMVDSLWTHTGDTDEVERPLYILLTPNRDSQVADVVRSHKSTCMIRCDRPEAIIQAIVDSRCKAADLPEAQLLRIQSL